MVLTLMLCLVGAGTIGCSSSGRAGESEKAVSSMDTVITQLSNAKKEVSDTVADLAALQSSADLKATFSTYTKDVADVKAAGDRAKERSKSMQENGRLYVSKWQSEIENTTNPEIKASMEQRKERVEENYSKIKAAAGDVRTAYAPFLTNLQEIQKALSLELSAASVQALQPSINKAKADGETLNQKIDALQSELREVKEGMAPPPVATQPTGK